MTEISTETKNYVIIFYDNSRKFITEKVALGLYNSGSKVKEFIVDRERISLASIAKILPLDSFYEQYPDQKPESVLPKFQGYSNLIELAPKRGLEQMIKGLKRYIDENADKLLDTSSSKMLLLTMQEKYELQNKDRKN